MKPFKRLLWLAVVAYISCPLHALDLSDLRTQIRRNVRDTATSSSLQRYSDSVLNSFINESQKKVINITWAIQKSTSHTLSVGTTYYSMPTDFLAIEQVKFLDSANRVRILEEVSERSLYQSNPDWQRQTGPPMNYFTQYSTASGTALEIAYIPVPTTSSTGTATVDYYSQADDLSSDSDVPFEGLRHLYPYHHALIYDTTARIKLIEGFNNEASVYIQMFNTDMTTMINKLGERPNYNPSFSAVGNTR